MKMTIKQLNTTTVVLPFEYDVEEFINSLIIISNRKHDHLVSSDVGKVVGIYNSAKTLYSVLLNVLMTCEIPESDLDEIEQALDSFARDSDSMREEE
jgi:hypothetical protein